MVMLKLGIDEGMANFFANGNSLTNNTLKKLQTKAKNITFSMNMGSYPSIPLRLYTNFSEAAAEGSFYLLLVPMLTFILITTDILKEKEKSLRKGMMTMGLRSSAYWMSWFITSFFFALISTVMTILAGNVM